MKKPLRETLKRIGGGHLLVENAKKTANQIFSSAKYSDKDISPLKIMAKSIDINQHGSTLLVL